jgi:hypothetical protein
LSICVFASPGFFSFWIGFVLKSLVISRPSAESFEYVLLCGESSPMPCSMNRLAYSTVAVSASGFTTI